MSDIINMFSVYKPPKTSINSLFAALDIALQSVKLDEKIVVLGDFNINILYQSGDAEDLVTYMKRYRLYPKIQQYTTDYRTCIDHIYTNIDGCVSGVGETYYSYHKIVWIAVQ